MQHEVHTSSGQGKTGLQGHLVEALEGFWQTEVHHQPHVCRTPTGKSARCWQSFKIMKQLSTSAP